jgi:hypothetical protein
LRASSRHQNTKRVSSRRPARGSSPTHIYKIPNFVSAERHALSHLANPQGGPNTTLSISSRFWGDETRDSPALARDGHFLAGLNPVKQAADRLLASNAPTSIIASPVDETTD